MSLDPASEGNPADGGRSKTLRCPTCRALQESTDTCRRCRSDLRLLQACAAAYERSRRACLGHLRSGSSQAALRAAERCHALRGDAESRRLLALAAWKSGDWMTAARLTHRI